MRCDFRSQICLARGDLPGERVMVNGKSALWRSD
jgi:hypothetical protein